MKLAQFLLFIFFYLPSIASYANLTELTIVSSKGKQAIEGAIVYDKKSRVGVRTDLKGKVLLDSGMKVVQIKAKYHKPQLLSLAELTSNTIVMQHDEKLLVAEQKLSYPKKNKLWGNYSEYRANNDLLSYDLSIKVDPDKKYISGNNKIRFKMLKADNMIQLDLYQNLDIDKILYNGKPLKYEREVNTVYISFPKTLTKDAIEEIDFHYSGYPKATGRFGCFTFKKDSLGKHWINTAC